jgi:hypothetical protein
LAALASCLCQGSDHHRRSGVAIPLSQQLRQPRHVDGDPASLILRQHLGLQRIGFVVPGVDVDERLAVGVADDVPARDRVSAAKAAESGG